MTPEPKAKRTLREIAEGATLPNWDADRVEQHLRELQKDAEELKKEQQNETRTES